MLRCLCFFRLFIKQERRSRFQGERTFEIICTNFASYDFVRQIVGDKAEVTMLLKPGAEAHSYEPSPKDIQAIGKSDLSFTPAAIPMNGWTVY